MFAQHNDSIKTNKLSWAEPNPEGLDLSGALFNLTGTESEDFPMGWKLNVCQISADVKNIKFQLIKISQGT